MTVMLMVNAMMRRRIDFLHGRRKHQVDFRGVTKLEIAVERARIAREVVWTIELQGVDEDTDRDNFIFRAASLHQGTVPPVKRSHRRHETDTAPFQAAPPGPPASQSV